MTTEAKYLKVARILQKRIEDGVYKTQKSLRWITKKRSCI